MRVVGRAASTASELRVRVIEVIFMHLRTVAEGVRVEPDVRPLFSQVTVLEV